jgi:5,6-dimethylbenzimidazole synthase
MPGPVFDHAFRARFAELLAWRRDVRRFRVEPVAEDLLDHLLDLACLAPSVGNSRPWRLVRVDDPDRRAAVRAEFARCNRDALEGQAPERRTAYAKLKLAGLDRAPVQLAVFCETAPAEGHGLGIATMPEALAYSTVTAVHGLWLAARAHGVGVGWVSILEPARVAALLEVPASWRLVAYLCLGWPEEEHADPELERAGWQPRTAHCREVWRR